MEYAPQVHTLPRINAKKGGNYLQGTNCFEKIGGHEILSSKLWRAAFAEMIATGLLMFTLIASVIASLKSHAGRTLSAGFNGILHQCLPLLDGRCPNHRWPPQPRYINHRRSPRRHNPSPLLCLHQSLCVGAVLGFLLIHSVISPEAEETYLLGGCSLKGNGETRGINPLTALALEFVCTFLLLFIGITVAFDKKRSKEVGLPWVACMLSAPMALGVFISITITGKAGYAGVGLNPARCLGPVLIRGGSLWHGHWVFWVGPILACILYYAITLTFPKKPLEVVEGDRDILSISGCFKASSPPTYIQK